jgi:hypothetical protein
MITIVSYFDRNLNNINDISRHKEKLIFIFLGLTEESKRNYI